MVRPFDSWRSVSLSLFMVLTGYAVLVGIPVITTAWVTKLGFTEVEAGSLAAADLGGLSMGAVLCAFLIARKNRRHLVLGAVLATVLANVGCVVATDYEAVLVLRLMAGLASGVYTGVAVASLGANSNPERAYSWVLLAFAFSQALELYLLPQLSMTNIYLFFAGAYALTLPFLVWLPARGSNDPAAKRDPQGGAEVPAFVPWLVLLALFFTYINIGTYWTYIELASLDSAADPEWVGGVLIASSVCSVLGCLAASMVSKKFGLGRPLILALLAQALVVSVLLAGIGDVTFAVSVFGFNFLWMFTDIFQLSTVAKVDRTGKFAALVPAAQGLGQIVGPVLAASLLASGFGYTAVFLLCLLASLVAVALYSGIVRVTKMRRALRQRHGA